MHPYEQQPASYPSGPPPPSEPTDYDARQGFYDGTENLENRTTHVPAVQRGMHGFVDWQATQPPPQPQSFFTASSSTTGLGYDSLMTPYDFSSHTQPYPQSAFAELQTQDDFAMNLVDTSLGVWNPEYLPSTATSTGDSGIQAPTPSYAPSYDSDADSLGLATAFTPTHPQDDPPQRRMSSSVPPDFEFGTGVSEQYAFEMGLSLPWSAERWASIPFLNGEPVPVPSGAHIGEYPPPQALHGAEPGYSSQSLSTRGTLTTGAGAGTSFAEQPVAGPSTSAGSSSARGFHPYRDARPGAAHVQGEDLGFQMVNLTDEGKTKRQPPSCLNCRKLKIACARPVVEEVSHLQGQLGGDGRCDQCIKRKRKPEECVYPKHSLRGLHSRNKSKRHPREPRARQAASASP
uniref:Zn(2)-C6 fungal-type domain-containing protein n=1 Tax=Mycena chlorophos TaxID=658473 RepID=A0ABQ0LXA1_MYCCL|nr:predicted protein [Mycena chlorophos]